MAKIVELSGPPGVGKTTIYREIKARWKKNNNWIPGSYLCPHPDLSFQYFRMFLSYLPKKLKGKAGGTFYDVKMAARRRFVEQYPEYMDACWHDLIVKQKKAFNGLDLRLKKAELLGGQIETFQFLRESTTTKTAILEEGLVHLLDVLSFCDTIEEIVQIVDVMPLPDALIYIKTDVSENVRRVMQRGDYISLHTSLDSNQLQNITRRSQQRRELINQVLEARGIPILHINAKVSIKENADQIIAFIEGFNATRKQCVKDKNQLFFNEK